MSESILTSTKSALGIAEDDTAFDSEITMHINSVLADVHQLGIGPDDGYEIADATETWADLLVDEKRYNGVASYVFLKVKMLFDPPSVGYVLTAYEKVLDKMEWRISNARENIVFPTPPDVDAGTVLDGGEL